MNYKKKVFFNCIPVAVVMAFMLMSYNPAQSKDAEKSNISVSESKKEKKSKKKHSQEPPKSDYEKLMEASDVKNGLFNVIRKGKDYYFEIPSDLLGMPMLVVNKFVRVPKELNEASVNRGVNFGNKLVAFELDSIDNKIAVREFRPLPDVDPVDALAISVKNNYISPIIASFKIEASNPDSSAYIIKINEIFDGTKTSFNDVFTDINVGTSADRDLSRIKQIKAFDNNVYAISELTTKVVEPDGTVNVTVEIGSSILLLPQEPLKRRYASPRIGYFTDSNLKYSDDQQHVDRQHFIQRWRLEPKPEDVEAYLSGKLVEPAKPIVFWLDNSTPYKWRKYLRQGIEDWNSAFEVAGFKNAIHVEQIPEDTDSIDFDDVNYSVLNYTASTKSNAMGPSITDPRSGEILEADIIWWHNVIDLVHDWIIIQTGAVDKRARSLDLPDELLGDAMRFVACHEVGHSLGLRHNMAASAAIPTDSLRSDKYLKDIGCTSASIMDYARFNYVAQPGDAVTHLSPQIGPYDRLAIEYGYRWFDDMSPEDEYHELQRLVDLHDTPLFQYSEAQDYREAVDPRALSEDLGDNSIKSAKYGIANLKCIVPNIIEWTTSGKPGQSYDDAARLLSSAVSQWQLYVYHVMANIGGIYMDNTTVGDGKPTFRFVETDKQREALQFIIDEALTQPSWLFDSDVTDYTFLVAHTPEGRVENSPNYILKNAQSFILWDLMADNRLIRMYENEAMNGDKAFTGVEMMDMLHNSIFQPTIANKAPDVRQRSVQKNFVDALIIAASENQGVKSSVKSFDADKSALFITNPLELHCFNNDPSRVENYKKLGEHPAGRRKLNYYGSQSNRISDAISLKRGELTRIRTLLLSKMSTSSPDARYHYQDLVMRINTALGIDQFKG